MEKKKRSRGAIQRERKKQKRELDADEARLRVVMKKESKNETQIKTQEHKKKVKPLKPLKKMKKVDKDDEKFENIVGSYRSRIEKEKGSVNPRASVEEKRWFE